MQENLQDMTNAEDFKNAFKPYLIRWGIVYAILITIIIFITVVISVPSWEFSDRFISWLLEKGAIFDRNNIHYSIITIGIINLSIISIGVNVFGVLAFGVNAVGVIAIGTNAVGVIAIGCNAVGVVTIGYIGFGFYVLSYSERCKGKYLFAPHRQDAEAVNFFSRWIPNLSDTLSAQ